MAKVKVDLKGTRAIEKAVRDALIEAVEDVTDDLVRTSSESAPHFKGILEQSYSREVITNRSSVVGVVDYSVVEGEENNGYDYAYWMHEGDYNLGEGSERKAASGGGVGMSGKSYPVGPKFLSGVLDGEAETYKEYMQKAVDNSLK